MTDQQSNAESSKVQRAKETPGHSPDCPNCEERGLETASKYRDNLLDCPNGECPVWKFQTYRGDGDE